MSATRCLLPMSGGGHEAPGPGGHAEAASEHPWPCSGGV